MRELNAKTRALQFASGGQVVSSCDGMSDFEPVFVSALIRPPAVRSLQDLQVIYYGLSGLEVLSTLRDSALRSLCKVVRYEKHQANDVLY